jgi:uncharacterized RDD family membrane protein YckC
VWYYYHNGQQVGPVPLDTIRSLIARGQFRPDDLVWREGMPQWAPVAQVAELASAMQTAPPPMPPGGYPAHYPPHASVGYYTPSQDAVYAGFWIRFCAAFIDGILLALIGAVLGLILGFVIGMMMGARGAAIEDIEATAELIGNILGFFMNWIYYAAFESSVKQATPGKMAVGIVVTAEAGQRISFGRATGRHFAKILSAIILLIGFIMAAFTERKQALHDIIAGTLVTYGKR